MIVIFIFSVFELAQLCCINHDLNCENFHFEFPLSIAILLLFVWFLNINTILDYNIFNYLFPLLKLLKYQRNSKIIGKQEEKYLVISCNAVLTSSSITQWIWNKICLNNWFYKILENHILSSLRDIRCLHILFKILDSLLTYFLIRKNWYLKLTFHLENVRKTNQPSDMFWK